MCSNEKSEDGKISLLGLVLDYIARKTQIPSVQNFSACYTNNPDSLENIFNFFLDKSDTKDRKSDKPQMIDINKEILNASEILFLNKKSKVSTMDAGRALHRAHVGVDDNLLHGLSYIRDGYSDLYNALDLNETRSDIEVLTKYILDLNIKVHHINILFSHITSTYGKRAEIRKFYKSYHKGRFTDVEDEIIRENWNDLCQSCYINDSQSVLKQMYKKENFHALSQKRQRNVIGCFLGRKLTRVRHGSDIYERLKITMSSNAGHRKKFSHEDDQIIMDAVTKNGETTSTWKSLAKKLNMSLETRSSYSSIRNRYLRLVNSSLHKRGKWTIEEDASLLEHLFTNKPCDIETVESINFLSLSNNEIKRDKNSVHFHYKCLLKPILLNYHLATLNSNWKYNFFIQIINKNYKSLKEVIWEEFLPLFPGQSQLSLTSVLHHAVLSGQYQNKDLNFCDAIKEHVRKIGNNEDYNESQKRYRQKIVEIYLKCTVPSGK